MKLHRTAEIALVGWFLITAPISDRGATIYQDAPLSQWTKAQRFDSESDCDTQRQELINDSQDAFALVPDSEVDQDDKQDAADAVNRAMVSRCVADDDPRIQGTAVNLGPSVVRKLVH